MYSTRPAGAGPTDTAWGWFTSVVSFPARIQGYLLNALVNTIDKVQTEHVMHETRQMLKHEEDTGHSADRS